MPDTNVLISFYGVIAVAIWLDAKPETLKEKAETGIGILFLLLLIMGVIWLFN